MFLWTNYGLLLKIPLVSREHESVLAVDLLNYLVRPQGTSI